MAPCMTSAGPSIEIEPEAVMTRVPERITTLTKAAMSAPKTSTN